MVKPVFKTQHVFNILKTKVKETPGVQQPCEFNCLKNLQFLNISLQECLKTEGFLNNEIHNVTEPPMFLMFLMLQVVISATQTPKS